MTVANELRINVDPAMVCAADIERLWGDGQGLPDTLVAEVKAAVESDKSPVRWIEVPSGKVCVPTKETLMLRKKLSKARGE